MSMDNSVNIDFNEPQLAYNVQTKRTVMSLGSVEEESPRWTNPQPVKKTSKMVGSNQSFLNASLTTDMEKTGYQSQSMPMLGQVL
jgi:hypothetical protein